MQKTGNKLLSLLLCLVLAFSLLPAAALAAEEAHEHDGITFTAWESDTSLPSEAGSFYLTQDVKLSGKWDVPEGIVNLCLNGHGIIRTTGFGSVIWVGKNTTLNLYDCGKTTTHYFSVDDANGLATVVTDSQGEQGDYSFTGGYITGGNGYDNQGDYGGGVYIVDKGAFNMYGGTIIGNQAFSGGGVRVTSGTFNMYDGRICFNSCRFAGGVRVKNSSGTMTMYGGKIDNNTATGIGGDDPNRGNGGGILIDDGGTLEMNGGVIENNKAKLSGDQKGGGGIYIAANSSLVISGGSVKNNTCTAGGQGGGICVYGTMQLSGNPAITGNKRGDTDNNVFLPSGKTIKIVNPVDGRVEIPVTVPEEASPTTTDPVDIAGPLINYEEDGAVVGYATSANFTSDEGYKVANNGNMAVFIGNDTQTVTIAATANPTDGGAVTGGDVYVAGAKVTVTATPNEGYSFTGMKKDGEDVEGDSYTFQANADASFEATFEKMLFTVTFKGDGGKVLQVIENVEYGDVPVYTEETPEKESTAYFHYLFGGWTQNGRPDPDESDVVDLAEESIEKDTTYYAFFKDLDHTFVDHPAVPATCTEAGSSEYEACSECGIFVSIDDEGLREIIEEGSWVIEATDHDWKFVDFTWTGSDADGYTAAVANYTCENNSGHTQTADAEITREATDAVCETGGKVVYTATVSANQSLDGEAHTATKTVEIDAAGHKLTGTEAKAATCTEDGNSAYWTCSVCGLYFSDADGENKIEKDSWVIPALGHDWGEWVTTTEAEVGKAGERKRICRNDPTHTETEPIPALDAVTVRVSFDPGEGSGTMEPVDVAPGTEYTLPACTFTAPAGKEFDAWEIGGERYTDAAYTVNADVTLTALWKAEPEPEPNPEPRPYYPIHVTPAPETKPELPFTDVTKDMDCYDDVKYVYEKGIMIGMSDTEFGPDTTLSRAMLVTVLYRMEGKPSVEYAGVFSDVPAGVWYSDAVEWAAAEGIVLGYGDGTFGVNDDVTREQLATIFWRYAKWKDYDVSVGEDTNILSFNDAFDTSDWAMAAMQWAIGSGVLEGDAYGYLNGGEPATRTEIAKAIHVFLETVAR